MARKTSEAFLQHRILESELMDDPALEPALHRPALRGLGRVNFFSGTVNRLANHIAGEIPAAGGRQFRFLDIACGGGDVTIGLAKRLGAIYPDSKVIGCDISPTAVEFARQSATRQGVTNVEFEVRDILNLDAASSADLANQFDAVLCTLFLHHLPESGATELVQAMNQLSRKLVIIDDLLRTRLGFVLAWCGCRLLSRSPIVHVDGPMSVKAAFTEQEFRVLVADAKIELKDFAKHWPERFMATWDVESV